jgi:phytanoyl-CoA hydroxylase
MDPQIKSSFEKDGFVFIKAFFNLQQVEEIKKQLADFIRDVVPGMPANHVLYEEKDRPETLKQLQDMQVHSPFFNALMTGSELEKTAELLLGEKVIGKNVEFFNKPARIGKATPPHQDAYYFNIKPPQAVTMWLALEEANTENGCVSYIRGSHLKGMRPHGRTKTLGFSQGITDFGSEEDKKDLQSFPATAGDLLIHHSMTIHCAGPNTSPFNSRKALGLIYFGESAQPDLEAREAYFKALNLQKTEAV